MKLDNRWWLAILFVAMWPLSKIIYYGLLDKGVSEDMSLTVMTAFAAITGIILGFYSKRT